ncbi:MAG: T9SS type B sorting domain-containing protein [Psychroflexus sp.]
MNKFVVFLVCITSLSVFGQGEANNWYFGDKAGITFNTNPPSAVTNGQLSTNEGCSSISDINGNLLMYTDGRTIWDRNHNIMPNADYFNGTGLNGDPSSTSSGLIVPHPTDPNLYFVFTVDEPHHENANAYPGQGPADRFGNSIPAYTDTERGVPEEDDGFNNGLNYSIVDISLNGGLGDVISGERNNELITYDENDTEEIKYKASEKITAVRGSDCNSVWVISHFRNKFYAFLIDQLGINETPAESEVEPLIEITDYRRAALGYLKASPQGDKLLIAHNTTNFNAQAGNSDAGEGNVYAYDFDNLTGTVSNPVKLIDDVNAYGVEFSQDGTKAYATVSDFTSKILQWDLVASDPPNSVETITNINQFNTALQLGPDGKIYHSIIGSSRLGVINNPNEIGNNVNYTQNQTQGAINLNGRSATFGLPPFIQSLFSQRIPIVKTSSDEVIEQVSLCDTYTYELSYEDIPGATYTWSKDGVVLSSETAHNLNISVNPTASFPVQENYRLEVDLNNGECPLIGVAQITFNESPAYSNDQLLACREPGENAVYDLNEIKAKLAQQGQINSNQINIEIYRNLVDASAENNPIPITSNFINSDALSSIVIKILTFGSCEDIKEFELIVEDLPDINLNNEVITYCLEEFPEPITLSALSFEDDPSLYEYSWSTGQNTSSITVNSQNVYYVDINIKGTSCFSRKTFIVTESNIASFDHEVERQGHSSNLELIINSSSIGDYEYAIDYPTNFQDSNTFENLNPGIYKVFVRDKLGCGISEKTIGVLGIMKFFTPNGDGINDVWEISGLLESNSEEILLQIYNRYGKLLKTFTNNENGWDGTYNGRDLPSDDYWYRIRLTDGTIETGNFTLKR